MNAMGSHFLHMVQLGTAWSFQFEAKVQQEKLQKPEFQDGAAELLMRSRASPLLCPCLKADTLLQAGNNVCGSSCQQ